MQKIHTCVWILWIYSLVLGLGMWFVMIRIPLVHVQGMRFTQNPELLVHIYNPNYYSIRVLVLGSYGKWSLYHDETIGARNGTLWVIPVRRNGMGEKGKIQGTVVLDTWVGTWTRTVP
jgi:hypothetical protein